VPAPLRLHQLLVVVCACCSIDASLPCPEQMVTHSELTLGLSISVVPKMPHLFLMRPRKIKTFLVFFFTWWGRWAPLLTLISYVCALLLVSRLPLSLSLSLSENWHPACSSKKQIGPYFFEKQNLAHFIISLEFGQDYRSKLIYLGLF